MGVVYYLMERLRQVVGSCWDYCVIWKLSEDPWLLECVDCCCGGSYQKSEEEEDVVFGGTTTTPPLPCKDGMFEHPRMRCCDLLSQLPPSLPLDGINAEVLISNQPRWLKNAKISDLTTADAEEMMESKVLIPVPGGLVEFYASKMVPEDQSLIDYVVRQCNALTEQQQQQQGEFQSAADFSTYSPSTALANLNLSSSSSCAAAAAAADATADRIRICNSAMNFLQQFSYLTDTQQQQQQQQQNEYDSSLLQQQLENGNGGEDEEEEAEKGGPTMKHEMMGRGESGSDSDPIDDEDDSKYSNNGRRKNGKGTSKNLIAERKRRKKLNERLYTLRSLVPKISKLDRAAILGDAIDYVMELQQQEKDLQNELEHNSEDDEDDESSLITNPSHIPMEYSNVVIPNNNYEPPSNGCFYTGSSTLNLKRSSHEDTKASSSTYDKAQQMEVQVEVAHLDGNEFFIKVFGEQKGGGFVRLMEALHSLGLEITTVNVTSCISLVSYVFTVEKKDCEIVQAEYLRDSLLEMTRNQSGEWAEIANKVQAGGGEGTTHHHLEQYQQQYFHQHQFHQFQ